MNKTQTVAFPWRGLIDKNMRLVWHWFIVIKVHLWILQGDTPQVLFQHVPEETG